MLKIINVTKSYGQTKILDGITFEVADREVVAIVGPNGCGKSTLLKIIAGLEILDNGEIKTEKEMKGITVFNYHKINIGFENTINKVLHLISSKKWQDKYEGGYFLFLFKSAIQRQIIETSFISCWTIWEHIFAIKNRKWLDNTAIDQMSGDKKISFILNEYFLKNINDTARKNIQKINKTRNRLIHFGKKTEQIDYKEMEMFIRLTEQLIAIILELSPSNIFNSFEDLDNFLSEKKK